VIGLGTRAACRLVAALTALGCLVPSAISAEPQDRQTGDARSQVEAGRQLFETTCVTCHGSKGVGATGPSLAHRDLTLDVIRNAVVNGRPGTPMPSFKDVFDPKSQAQFMAYVLWLASDGRLPITVIASEPAPAAAQAAAAQAASTPVEIGKDQGVPESGARIFFDATRVHGCRDCHSYDKKGGPVGPDLRSLDMTPLAVFRSISQSSPVPAEYPAVMLTMRNGIRLTGIGAEESPETLRLFDVSSDPPVLRTILKADVSNRSAITDVGIFDHETLGYSKPELLNLSAFLGKTSSPVRPEFP
jgi:mono/diheme cytochrome c family protein